MKQCNSTHSPSSKHLSTTVALRKSTGLRFAGASSPPFRPRSEVLADVLLVCLPVLLLDLIDLVLQLHDSPLNLIVLTYQGYPTRRGKKNQKGEEKRKNDLMQNFFQFILNI